MRQLNNLAKALGLFLSDPAAHVTAAWATVRAAIDPEAAKKPGPLRDALVVCDTAMAAVSGFLNSDPAARLIAESKQDAEKQPELPTGGQS